VFGFYRDQCERANAIVAATPLSAHIARELTDNRTGLGQRYQEHRPPEMRTVFPPHTDRPFRPASAGSHLRAREKQNGGYLKPSLSTPRLTRMSAA
jgi:hypothetical protein